MEDIVRNFEEAFKDRIFTKAEKKAIREVFDDYSLDKRKRELLIDKVFQIAQSSVHDYSAGQIIQWLETATKIIMQEDMKSTVNKVYFSPGTDCVNAIIDFFHSANHTLRICVFTISDNNIVNALLQVRKQKNLHVKVLTDNDKSFDHGSDVQALADAGIEVRIDNTTNHMHHKFALADTRLALTGSYNWTRSACLYNHENLLITDNSEIIKAYTREFDKLWEEMENYQL